MSIRDWPVGERPREKLLELGSQTLSEAELLALPSAVDLTTAGRAFGIGRTKAFELARAGEFPVKVIRVGLKFRVSKAVILEALGVTAAAPTGEPRPAARRPTFPAHLGQDVPVAEGQQLPEGPLDQPNPHDRAQKVAEVNVAAVAALRERETPTPFPAERTGGPP